MPAPASVRLVTPFARHSSIASSSARRTSSGERSGGSTSPCALSTNTPVASPVEVRMISPPAGAFVSRVIPFDAIAFALARTAWPSARSSDDRVVGRGRGERGLGGEAAHRPRRRRVPLALVPAAPADPLAGPSGLHGLCHPLDHLGVAARAHEVHVEPREADPEHVRVRVVEAGDDGAAREVEHARPRTDQRQDLRVRADRHDAVRRARRPPRRGDASHSPCGRSAFSRTRSAGGGAAAAGAARASTPSDTARRRDIGTPPRNGRPRV